MNPIPSKRFLRIFSRLDLFLFSAGMAVLLCMVLITARVNIVSDSVDYYAILQKLTSPQDTPIARSLHFVEQRSPGYSIAAMIPYAVISLAIEPFSTTEKVMDDQNSGNQRRLMPPPREYGFRAGMPPRASMEEQDGAVENAPGPKFMQFPSVPVLLRNVFFKDFYITTQGSWFRWKTALALAVTSYIFLFGGMIAAARMLKFSTSSVPGYALITALIFLSPIFMQNIIDRPLFSTLATFGMSSFFMFFFMTGFSNQSTWKRVTAGMLLGFLVLIRLEAAIFAIALVVMLTACGKRRMALMMTAGGAVALAVLIAYNCLFFGTPFHIGILKGDINQFGLNFKYIFENLVHPQSGLLFWSPLLVPGLAGLLASRRAPLRLLGWSSVALLCVYLVRIPVMYTSMGKGAIDIGGIAIAAAQSPSQARQLIRMDINRYVILFAPFAVLGLRDGIGRLVELRRSYVPKIT